ncbi:thioesterase II family protein [Nonomuraea zeae]|uniref:Thioesterase n=1 Tax=Nonomuraea zeae TaxID=1642303 RepID=A0A5S4FGV5_9ACTN|nr:alpha/beta fold hydrolase [Nonomuraea zeae]TMR18715.1 thioesterase [Nonomuraea zeae]
MGSLGSGSGKWVRRFHAVPTGKIRLFCFPHAGGSASYYFPMSRSFDGRDVEVLAVQYPGRQDRRAEPCVTNLAELADRIGDALDEWTDMPFAFWGHSMGALLAFEVARRREALGRSVPLVLFASGRRAPSRYRDGRVHLLDDPGLTAELTRLGGTDPRLLAEPDLRAAILPTTRADYQAVETYVDTLRTPVSCPITAVIGDSDPDVTLEEAADWAMHTKGRFDLKVLPGGHFYLESRRREVLAIITGALKRSLPVPTAEGTAS